MGLILAFYVLMLQQRRPYNNLIIEWLDITITTCLFSLGALSLFDTRLINNSSETKESRLLYEAFQILKLIILFLPPVMFVVCFIAEKCCMKRSAIVKGKYTLEELRETHQVNILNRKLMVVMKKKDRGTDINIKLKLE